MYKSPPKHEPGLGKDSPDNNTNDSMSDITKVFIQKICYKRAASIDMTRNGFMKYTSKSHHLNLLLKPLKEQLDKILGKYIEKPRNSRRKSLPKKQSPSKKSLSMNRPPSRQRSATRNKEHRGRPASRRIASILIKKGDIKLKKKSNKQDIGRLKAKI